jgi:hypothetical protein
MTTVRLGSTLAAGVAGLVLAASAQATPTSGDGAIPGMKLQLRAPLLLAEAPAQPPASNRAPDPYVPPQPSTPYSPPAPGAYPQPAPGYPPYAPPPVGYPVYYQPLDMRPPTLEYDPDKPIPPGYRVESSARKGFVVSGSIIFGISYGFALAIAAAANEEDQSSYSSGVPYNPGMLYIPIIGPWVALGTMHDAKCSSSYYSSYCSSQDTIDAWRTLLIIDGVAEVWGAAFVVLGLSWRWRQLVLTDNVRAQIVPVQMGPTGRGLAMVGTFGGI